MNKEIESILIKMLGQDAFNSTDYKVTPVVGKLVHAVTYLVTQIGITASKFEDKEDRKEHVEGVLMRLESLLSE